MSRSNWYSTSHNTFATRWVICGLKPSQVPTLVVLHGSYGPVQVGPRVKRNGGIAVVLGIVVGLTLVVLWDVLDTRVRSLDTLSNALRRLPLLGRLPTPSRALRNRGRPVMLTAPTQRRGGADSHAASELRVSVRAVGAKTIMFTSGVGGEGKSTTVANLAVALAGPDAASSSSTSTCVIPASTGFSASAERRA